MSFIKISVYIDLSSVLLNFINKYNGYTSAGEKHFSWCTLTERGAYSLYVLIKSTLN